MAMKKKKAAKRKSKASAGVERERSWAEKELHSLRSRLEDISESVSYAVETHIDGLICDRDLEGAIEKVTEQADKEHALIMSEPYKQGWNDAVAAMSGLMMKDDSEEEERDDS